jgi:hypothetical protein
MVQKKNTSPDDDKSEPGRSYGSACRSPRTTPLRPTQAEMDEVRKNLHRHVRDVRDA